MVSLGFMTDLVILIFAVVVFVAGFWSGRKVEHFVRTH